jgi:transcription elongation factor Elf1
LELLIFAFQPFKLKIFRKRKRRSPMTKVSTTEFVCPECGLEQLFTVYDSVNISLNPDYKEKLINGELTIFTCDACGYQVEVVYPILYHDMDNKLMIWMDPDGQLDPNGLGNKQFLFDTLLDESYQYRIVSTREELVEKILIFDDNLEDKPLEMLKYYIRESFLSKGDDPDETVLYYGGRGVFEDEGEVVLINKLSGPDQKSFRVPIGKYQEIKEEYTNYYPDLKDGGRWQRVNENYFK